MLASRIVDTACAAGALVLALACLANPGSEWLLPDPWYPCNRHFVKSFDAVPVGMPVGSGTGFQPTVDDLARHFNNRTAGVMVASPANPTGTMLSAEAIGSIAAFTRDRGLHLIVDEIYHGLTYDGDAPTALAAGAAGMILANRFGLALDFLDLEAGLTGAVIGASLAWALGAFSKD